MLVLEIILIAIGLIAVVMSFKVSDYGNSDKGEMSQGEKESMESSITQKSREAFQDQLEEAKEETIQMASDELSRISNEKLMGMDEYSTQVLEKIGKNHEEVVFLYNMLGEKEEEIKKLVHHVDTVKAQMHEEVAGEYQKLAQVLKQLEKKRALLEHSIQQQMPLAENSDPQKQEREKLNAVYDKEIQAIEEAETKEQPQYFPKASEKKKEKKTREGNHNNEIIELYKKGHSILEISRMLSLGQGEVKFVIDLHEAQ